MTDPQLPHRKIHSLAPVEPGRPVCTPAAGPDRRGEG
jgi:hypothetical protein